MLISRISAISCHNHKLKQVRSKELAMRFMKRKKWLIGLLVVLPVIAIACGDSANEPDPVVTPDPPTPVSMEDMMTADDDDGEEVVFTGLQGIPGGYLERALNGEFSGTEVDVFGPCRDGCEQAWDVSFAQFTELTGIVLDYQGSAQAELQINTQVAAGQKPDIADFPQLGIVQKFVSAGEVIPLTDFLSEDYLKQQYADGWVELSTVKGPDGEPFVAGAWNVTRGTKSLVWYAKDDFEAAGYEIPETWQELVDLTNQIRNDGGTPWCLGIGSGDATGWIATDWTEDMLLRTVSLEDFDRWWNPASEAERLRFNSPEVRNAIELWSELWFTEGNVVGNRAGIVDRFFNVTEELFTDPADCYLHKEDSSVTGGWANDFGAVADEDYGVFYFPPVDPNAGRPMLGAGSIFFMMNDRPEVRAVMEFLTTPQSMDNRIRNINSGDISPFRATRVEDYGNEVARLVASILATSTAFRFDASDVMPSRVGSGAFWVEITKYVAGDQDLTTTLDNIDAAWPTDG